MQAMRVSANGDKGNRQGRPSRFFASSSVFGSPRDDRVQEHIAQVRSLAEFGVDAVVADGQRVAIGLGLSVLLFPYPATLEQLAMREAAENAVRGDHWVRACDGFDREAEVEGQGRDGADALGGFDVGTGELDQVRGHYSSSFSQRNDGHLATGQGIDTPKASRE